MPSVYDLKPRFQALLRPLMTYLVRAGLRPNAVTLIAVAGSLLTGMGVSQAQKHPALLLLLPSWLFARMAFNALDGMMARELNMATPLGAVLNELGDVVSDLFLYLPLAAVCRPAQWSIFAFSLGAVLTEFSGLLGSTLGAGRRYDGPMGKSDRAFLVGALSLITFIVPATSKFWPGIFAVAALLAVVTCAKRVSGALSALRRGKAGEKR
jgi:CDP-diacylglycerol--glycerol-3-phosphate 3-phosphatidyltransferase